MHRIVAGGTGFIGRHLVRHWLDNGVDVTVISRDKNKVKQCFGIEVQALSWDECDKVENLAIFKSADVLVNLCGASIGDKRWSASRKRELIDSRIAPTQKLVEILLACEDQAPTLYQASAIGTYGLQATEKEGLPPALDEETPIDYLNASDFLATLGRKWEKTLAPLANKQHRCVIMRFGVVLSPDGGALKKMLLPFKMGLGGMFGSGQQPWSWIALEDLIAAIDFLTIHPEMTGVVNCTAPKAVANAKFTKTLADVLHRPCWFWQPAVVIKMLFGQMGDECLLRGQHVIPKRLNEAGFTFYYPSIEKALKSMLAQ